MRGVRHTSMALHREEAIVWSYLTLRRSEQDPERRVACNGAGRRLYEVWGRSGSASGKITVVDADQRPVAVVRERLARRHSAAIRRPGKPVTTVRWSNVSGSDRIQAEIDGVAKLWMRGDLTGAGAEMELDADRVGRVSPLGRWEYSIAVAPDFDHALAVSLVVTADLLAH